MSGRARTSFGPVVVVGLGSAALATVAAGRSWAEATTKAQGTRTVTASGTDVAPACLTLALVALACWGAVLVLRSRGRRVVSVLGFVAAVGAALATARSAHQAGGLAESRIGGASDVTIATTAWPAVALVAVLVAAVAFVAAFAKAPSWPEMSSRYDAPVDGGGRPGDAEALSDAELWRALDQGEDPTQDPTRDRPAP